MKNLYTKFKNYLRREADYCDYLRIEHPKEYNRQCFELKNSANIVRLWGLR